MSILRWRMRNPDQHIGGVADPYMKRWWLRKRDKGFCVYLHQFLRSDAERDSLVLPPVLRSEVDFRRGAHATGTAGGNERIPHPSPDSSGSPPAGRPDLSRPRSLRPLIVGLVVFWAAAIVWAVWG